MKTLEYVGSGPVQVPGLGNVAPGDKVEVDDDLAEMLVTAHPNNWRAAKNQEAKDNG